MELKANKQSLLAEISASVIGSHHTTSIQTVFGQKPHMYLDYAASGKSLTFIEDYIEKNVMPLYANSHSMQDASGKYTVNLREEARRLIKDCINAT